MFFSDDIYLFLYGFQLQIFEDNLREAGLELEPDYFENSGLYFVKIHSLPETLKRYGEILKLHMPIKDVLIFSMTIFIIILS